MPIAWGPRRGDAPALPEPPAFYAACTNDAVNNVAYPARLGSAMSTTAYNDELTSITSQRLPGPYAAPVFQRPGPEVLSETIPVIFIGRNGDGFWVVRDAEARFGGLFWREQAALDFAKTNALPGGYAVVFPQARFELDLKNHGNRLIAAWGQSSVCSCAGYGG